ncbi:DUF1906 domain-containing protein [Streptomyces sp. VRA16 Mangrove soil]|uniref:DUF1906 domain-containing protein n=1 Tax=Streptomyces sp. VRA16 Mangrove soil TaxID=2817434 RepID=UPI001A9F7EC9|nr:DUF1906 domain-containing protein [Streptomyces sp. VRA16 Mangrove soil]MBO1336680.1 DUF1906 domain-containing protein [Streptomyces sp. VRA16 Mangrove soil]
MYRQKVIMGLVVFLVLLAGPGGGLPEATASGRAAVAGRAVAGAAGSAPWSAPVRTFRGWAFDICQAPPRDTMRRWKRSAYRAVGVYYGGRGRFCRHQRNLSHGWLRAVDRMGWRVLPVYVGSQSPCVGARHKKGLEIGRKPWRQGVREGRDAARRAGALGIRPSSPLYLDMEAYAYGKPGKEGCAHRTLSFVRGWDKEVRRHGYVPGFYSSAGSGVRHMEAARRAGVPDLPSVMWFARWHTRPRLDREPALRRAAWHPERRIHQFAGNVKERHGGRTLVIDKNLVHAPVARIR